MWRLMCFKRTIMQGYYYSTLSLTEIFQRMSNTEKCLSKCILYLDSTTTNNNHTPFNVKVTAPSGLFIKYILVLWLCLPVGLTLRNTAICFIFYWLSQYAIINWPEDERQIEFRGRGIKGTQAWEFFGLWFRNLYFFVVSYA